MQPADRQLPGTNESSGAKVLNAYKHKCANKKCHRESLTNKNGCIDKKPKEVGFSLQKYTKVSFNNLVWQKSAGSTCRNEGRTGLFCSQY